VSLRYVGRFALQNFVAPALSRLRAVPHNDAFGVFIVVRLLALQNFVAPALSRLRAVPHNDAFGVFIVVRSLP
jgi:hypothetical protein